MERQEQNLEPDFLDEMVAERTKADPAFPRLVEAATRRRLRTGSLTAPASDDGDGDLQ